MLTGLSSFSQMDSSAYKDEFQLKNGLKFRGKIIDFNNERILIEKADSTLIHLKHDEFSFIRQYDPALHFKSSEFIIHSDRRILGQIMLGGGFGGGHDNFLSAISFQAGIMYKIKPGQNGHFLRLNTGAESYNGLYDSSLLPLTAGYEYNFIRNKVSPFISVDGGYSFSLTAVGNDEWPSGSETRSGGPRWDAGMGFKFRSSNQTAFQVQASYVHQQTSYEFNSGWGGTSSVEYVFRRIFIKVGIVF